MPIRAGAKANQGADSIPGFVYSDNVTVDYLSRSGERGLDNRPSIYTIAHEMEGASPKTYPKYLEQAAQSLSLNLNTILPTHKGSFREGGGVTDEDSDDAPFVDPCDALLQAITPLFASPMVFLRLRGPVGDEDSERPVFIRGTALFSEYQYLIGERPDPEFHDGEGRPTEKGRIEFGRYIVPDPEATNAPLGVWREVLREFFQRHADYSDGKSTTPPPLAAVSYDNFYPLATVLECGPKYEEQCARLRGDIGPKERINIFREMRHTILKPHLLHISGIVVFALYSVLPARARTGNAKSAEFLGTVEVYLEGARPPDLKDESDQEAIPTTHWSGENPRQNRLARPNTFAFPERFRFLILGPAENPNAPVPDEVQVADQMARVGAMFCMAMAQARPKDFQPQSQRLTLDANLLPDFAEWDRDMRRRLASLHRGGEGERGYESALQRVLDALEEQLRRVCERYDEGIDVDMATILPHRHQPGDVESDQATGERRFVGRYHFSNRFLRQRYGQISDAQKQQLVTALQCLSLKPSPQNREGETSSPEPRYGLPLDRGLIAYVARTHLPSNLSTPVEISPYEDARNLTFDPEIRDREQLVFGLNSESERNRVILVPMVRFRRPERPYSFAVPALFMVILRFRDENVRRPSTGLLRDLYTLLYSNRYAMATAMAVERRREREEGKHKSLIHSLTHQIDPLLTRTDGLGNTARALEESLRQLGGNLTTRDPGAGTALGRATVAVGQVQEFQGSLKESLSVLGSVAKAHRRLSLRRGLTDDGRVTGRVADLLRDAEICDRAIVAADKRGNRLEVEYKKGVAPFFDGERTLLEYDRGILNIVLANLLGNAHAAYRKATAAKIAQGFGTELLEPPMRLTCEISRVRTDTRYLIAWFTLEQPGIEFMSSRVPDPEVYLTRTPRDGTLPAKHCAHLERLTCRGRASGTGNEKDSCPKLGAAQMVLSVGREGATRRTFLQAACRPYCHGIAALGGDIAGAIGLRDCREALEFAYEAYGISPPKESYDRLTEEVTTPYFYLAKAGGPLRWRFALPLREVLPRTDAAHEASGATSGDETVSEPYPTILVVDPALESLLPETRDRIIQRVREDLKCDLALATTTSAAEEWLARLPPGRVGHLFLHAKVGRDSPAGTMRIMDQKARAHSPGVQTVIYSGGSLDHHNNLPPGAAVLGDNQFSLNDPAEIVERIIDVLNRRLNAPLHRFAAAVRRACDIFLRQRPADGSPPLPSGEDLHRAFLHLPLPDGTVRDMLTHQVAKYIDEEYRWLYTRFRRLHVLLCEYERGTQGPPSSERQKERNLKRADSAAVSLFDMLQVIERKL